jgi:hypothetical protein
MIVLLSFILKKDVMWQIINLNNHWKDIFLEINELRERRSGREPKK